MIVIFGAGALGSRLYADMFHEEPVLVSREQCDITDTEQILQVMGKYSPDTVVNAAAVTAVDWCENNMGEAFNVNAVGAGKLALAAASHEARFIHFSTDYVFSGRDGPYRDDDVPFPVNEYGRSKLWGEHAVRAYHPQAVIFRIGWLYGVEYPTSAPFRALTETETEEVTVGYVRTKKHKRFNAWGDVKGTPTWLGDVTLWVAKYLAGPDWRGKTQPTYHLAPPEESQSWYEFLSELGDDRIRQANMQRWGGAARPKRGGLIPSAGAELPPGGLDRFCTEVEVLGLI